MRGPSTTVAGMRVSDSPSRRDGASDVKERAPVELVVISTLAVLAGLVLRFVTRSPLWLDEALSVNIARLPLGEIPGALRHDGHPPLYYLMLHGWMQVLGTGDLAVRSLSGIVGVIALPLAWLAGRRRGGSTLGWLTVGVLALSPFALRYATETRMYSLVIMLVFVGYLLIDDVVRAGRTGVVRLAGIALVSAALLWSHYWSLWLLAAVALVLVWNAWRGGDAAVRHGSRLALLAVALGAVTFVAWLPSMLYQAAHTGTPWAGPQRPMSVLATTLADFGGGGFRDAEFVGAMVLVLLLLGLFGEALDARRIELDLRTRRQFRSEAIVLSATLGIGCVVIYATWSAFAPRYAAVFFPFVVILVAGGLSRFASRAVRAGAFAVLLGSFCMGAVWNVTHNRSQAREIGAAISAKAAPGDVVVFCPDQLGPAGTRELPPDVQALAYPNLGSPERVDWVDYAQRNARTDPAEVARELVERTKPSQGIFVVYNGEYETLEGQCGAFVDTIGATRQGGSLLVPDGGEAYFEHAAAVYFPPLP